jgi:hypothetical protein
MHRVVLLISCDSCGKTLSQASICDQTSSSWRSEIGRFSRKIAYEFDLLRGRARRTGWQCADPSILCCECVNHKKQFAQTITEETKNQH